MAQVANRALGSPRHGEYAVDDRVVSYACPRCGELDSLNGYAIGPDGKVTPPWSCPVRGCGAASWLHLEAWGYP
jgi:hypothetical protein